ncbi:MAG: hypothetical protein MSH47_08755 [Bacteroidales bacterium]|nr:hypothetical protein [Bacteroidales bacterium]
MDKAILQDVALHGLVEFGFGIDAKHTFKLLPRLGLRIFDEAYQRVEVDSLFLVVCSLGALGVATFGEQILFYICLKFLFFQFVRCHSVIRFLACYIFIDDALLVDALLNNI